MVDFDLPECPGGKRWTRLVDTNAPDDNRQPDFEFGDTYQVTGRSLLLFLLEPDGP
jgi:isoamylase